MDNISWKIGNLCKSLSIEYKILGPDDVDVCGIQLNSQKVKCNDAFFCIVGQKLDGHKYAENALQFGASCIFVEHEIVGLDVTQIVVPNTRNAMAQIAKAFYYNPTCNMNVIGITGTNGKTTITNIVSHVLNFNKIHNGLIGTAGIKIDGKISDEDQFEFVGRTTPEAFQLQKMMYEFKQLNINYVVMEVSSHALIQNRVDGINFSVTAFTNLSQDHLDYHKDMDDYFNAKEILFSDKYPARRVICIDDEWGQKLYEKAIKSGCDAISVSLNKNANYNLDNVSVDFPLIGKFNKQNMLVAYGICKQLGLNDKDITSALTTMPEVEGRMQRIDCINHNFSVFVDYCHTPDALHKAIATLKEECEGRVIAVFGCGGDRDKDKRPKMGCIACRLSDYVIITSDNPRSENPLSIISDIEKGISQFENFEIEVDRKLAINKAISLATNGDFVLIAGKGHEKYQEINNEKIHFDDVEVVEDAIKLIN